jgi:hypothetical protein
MKKAVFFRRLEVPIPGYSARKGTCIGMEAWKAFFMVLLSRLSR